MNDPYQEAFEDLKQQELIRQKQERINVLEAKIARVDKTIKYLDVLTADLDSVIAKMNAGVPTPEAPAVMARFYARPRV